MVPTCKSAWLKAVVVLLQHHAWACRTRISGTTLLCWCRTKLLTGAYGLLQARHLDVQKISWISPHSMMLFAIGKLLNDWSLQKLVSKQATQCLTKAKHLVTETRAADVLCNVIAISSGLVQHGMKLRANRYIFSFASFRGWGIQSVARCS